MRPRCVQDGVGSVSVSSFDLLTVTVFVILFMTTVPRVLPFLPETVAWGSRSLVVGEE